MATPSDIRAAWDAAIWTHTTILAMSGRIFDYELLDDSQFQMSDAFYEGEINFFTYTAKRMPESYESGGGVTYRHDVVVSYYKEGKAEAYNAVIDNLVTLEALVRSELGETWSSNVNYYRLESRDGPEQVLIDGRASWRGQYLFQGFERTTL